MNDLYNALFGVDVVVMWEHDDGEPKRKHKKKRIAKKWLKRYGAWSSPCKKGQIFWFNNFTFGRWEKHFYVSRNTYAMIKDHTRWKTPKFESCWHHGNANSFS